MRRPSFLVLASAIAACSSEGNNAPADAGRDATADTVVPTDTNNTDAPPEAAPPSDVMPPPDGPAPTDSAMDAAPDAPPPADVPADAPPDVLTCMIPQVACGGMCVDTQTDSANCGACGTMCPTGQRCTAGTCMPPCAPEQTSCMGTCVNLRSDNMNCGACGTACPTGQMCSAGACVTTCTMGTTLCGAGMGRPGSCIDLLTDSSNCGACSAACTMGQVCAAGACACRTGLSLCGSSCVNTQTDLTNCGRCGNTCTMGQTCVAGECVCPMGQTACSGACVNTQTSNAHCGACTHACATGQTCTGGVCLPPSPPNDSCATPTVIDLTRGTSLTVMGTTTVATSSANSCTPRPDVFYQFTLTAREIVYFDTFGTAWDTYLGLQRPGCASAATSCIDDACGNVQTQLVQALDPGTYLLVVDQFGSGGGDFTLHVQHFPAGSGTVELFDMSDGMRRLTGTTRGTGTVASTCCSDGPENAYYALTCPTFVERGIRATTCDLATFDTALDFRSGNRATGADSLCNNDSCGSQSLLTGRIPAGAGLHVLYADGCSAGAGAYSIDLTIGD